MLVLLVDLRVQKLYCVYCYSPNHPHLRDVFWMELDTIEARWSGAWYSRGDELLGWCQISGEMRGFSNWISSHNQVDLCLKEIYFTWSNDQNPLSVSRLGRSFFILGLDENVFGDHPTTVWKPGSDHCIIFFPIGNNRFINGRKNKVLKGIKTLY